LKFNYDALIGYEAAKKRVEKNEFKFGEDSFPQGMSIEERMGKV
jgi:hypothetical protein